MDIPVSLFAYFAIPLLLLLLLLHTDITVLFNAIYIRRNEELEAETERLRKDSDESEYTSSCQGDAP